MSSPTILVVDDEPAIRRFLTPFLAAEGYAVVEAATGREALALAESHDPDVILLDLGLPDLDGEEVLRALPMWRRARVIVLSVRSRERTDSTMTLARRHMGRARSTSSPSRSGNPRSSRMTSGSWDSAKDRASRPVAASTTV